MVAALQWTVQCANEASPTCPMKAVTDDPAEAIVLRITAATARVKRARRRPASAPPA